MQLGWDSLAIVACKKGGSAASCAGRAARIVPPSAGGRPSGPASPVLAFSVQRGRDRRRDGVDRGGADRVLAIQDSSELAFGGEAPCDCAPSRRPGQAAPPST